MARPHHRVVSSPTPRHDDHPRVESSTPPLRRLTERAGSRLPGLAVALLIAGVATVAGLEVPVVGGPVFGIVIGALVATVFRPTETLRPGLTFASKPVLQTSIVVLGATLS
ncbi:integral membrane protein, partial [Pseudonocardia sediminis]